MTDKNRTEVVCILDRSGSMGLIWDDAIGGLKTFIEDQKKDKDDTRLTLIAFDSKYERVTLSKSIHEFDTNVLNTIIPRAATALHDALGKSINDVGDYLRDLGEDERPDNVIFCILTDGQENDSREFSIRQVRDMITHQTEKYNWTFTYLGANQDAFAVGGQLGLDAQFCGNISASAKGMRGSYGAYSSMVRSRKLGEASFDMQKLVDDEDEG